MKTAIIDVGGGMQAAFAAGVLSGLEKDHISFDLCYGVSAGAANLVNYLARDMEASRAFYMDPDARKKVFSFSNYLTKGSYVDLDRVYDDPEKLARALASRSELTVVATNAMTGAPAYFAKRMLEKHGMEILKASSSLPPACPPYLVGNIPYLDGGIADLVPVRRALEQGAEKIVLLSTYPMEEEANLEKFHNAALLFDWKYPGAAKALRENVIRYNESVRLVKELQAQGKLLSIYADDVHGVQALSRGVEGIPELWEQGEAKARLVKDFLGADLGWTWWKRLTHKASDA
ncbi:patatin family protein [uncultured Faecalibaculum sp.]|uniref:patatin-like phospholipase family protein n=1 Tax=uncultured Faecalibaculum sp. TaxID=1729681 RepID=UPI0025FAB61F|nr:patatin family protein [uncultured Faecalibaculum sp.]